MLNKPLTFYSVDNLLEILDGGYIEQIGFSKEDRLIDRSKFTVHKLSRITLVILPFF